MATRQTVPNPFVYLNYLEPETASQYEITRDVYLVTLGVSRVCFRDACECREWMSGYQALIWDILSTVEQDWQLLRISKPSLVFIAYHLSR